MQTPSDPAVGQAPLPNGKVSDLEPSSLWETIERSTQLANQNLVQQNSISYQQALSQIAITGISKCFQWISRADPAESQGQKRIEIYRSMMDQLNDMVRTAAQVAGQTHQPSSDSGKESQPVRLPDSNNF